MTTPAGSGVTNKGTTYADGSQVTSTNLNDIVDDAVFNTNAVDDATIGLNSSTPKALFVKNAGIDTAQLKDNAVTTAKITNANVTTDKIADTSVTTAKIAADAITSAKIADDVALGGNPTTTTQATSNNTTKIATTAFVNDLLATFTASAPSGDGMSNSGSVTLPGGLIIKYGKNVDSTSDDPETFTFPSAFPNNHFVTITNTAKANNKDAFAVTSMVNASFQIDRKDDLSNPQSFHFLSLGN